jgi:hypothetical protein
MDDKENQEYQKRRTEIESTSQCVNDIQSHGVRYGYDAAFVKILPRCEGYVVVFQYNYLVDKYNQEEPKRKFEFVDSYPEALEAIKKRWNLNAEQYEKVMDILLSDYNLYQGGYTNIKWGY